MTDSRYSKQTKKEANKQTLNTGLKTRKKTQSKRKILKIGTYELRFFRFFCGKKYWIYDLFVYSWQKKEENKHIFVRDKNTKILHYILIHQYIKSCRKRSITQNYIFYTKTVVTEVILIRFNVISEINQSTDRDHVTDWFHTLISCFNKSYILTNPYKD